MSEPELWDTMTLAEKETQLYSEWGSWPLAKYHGVQTHSRARIICYYKTSASGLSSSLERILLWPLLITGAYPPLASPHHWSLSSSVSSFQTGRPYGGLGNSFCQMGMQAFHCSTVLASQVAWITGERANSSSP